MSFTGISKKDFTLIKGNTFGPVYFQISLGSYPINPSSLSIKSSVKDFSDPSNPLIILSFNPILYPVSPSLIFFELFKPSSSTSSLTPGIYHYDISLIHNSNIITFLRGRFRII